MSDDGLIQLFQTQFSTRLDMKLQQMTSGLRGKVEEGSHTGSRMASPINLVGPMAMRTSSGRFAQKANIPADYSKRWVVPVDKVGDQYVDSLDKLKTPIDPQSKLVASAVSACGREFDDSVIYAATAAATIGSDAGSLTTEAFDTANFQIAANFKASAAVGLTVAKLSEVVRIFEHYHVNLQEDPATCVIGSKQHDDLRNQAQVTSSDFNKNGGVLVEGRVTRYMGFNLIVNERLPIVTTNVRGILCFVKSGIYTGIWQDTKTEVFRRPDLENNPWDISTVLSIGSTRTQLGKVVQVLCADTTGADITP